MRPALEQFREALRRGDHHVRMLVPTATMAEHTRHTLAREGFVIQPHWIDTLAGFSRRWSQGWREASPAALTIMVHQALEQLPLPELDRVRDLPGVASALARAIEELSTAGCRPEQLRGAQALEAVYTWVDGALRARHLLMRADLLRLAAKRVHASGTLWLDGFLAFSDPELEFISALKRSAQVRIAPPPPPEHPEVQVFRAPTIDREAQAIAVRILQSGCEFRDVAVVARNPAGYEEPVRSAFHRYGIPVRVLDAFSHQKQPFLRLNDAFVQVLSKGWDQAVLLGLLRDAGHLQSIDEYDFKVRKRIPQTGLQDLPEPFASRFPSLEPISAEKLKPADWPSRFEAMWRAVELQPTGMEPALREAADLIGDEELSLVEFWRKVRPAVQVSAPPDDDRRRNVAHFLSVYEARQWNLPVMFLCGLSDGVFPRPWPSTPFLPDSLRRSLRASGLRVRLPEDWDQEERQLFDSVRFNATSRLVMSFSGGLASEFLDGFEVEEIKALPLPLPLPKMAQSKPEIGGWYRERQTTLSPSGLEMFQECPFRYFAGRVLRLNARPPRPEERLDFLLRGTIVHEVLAKGGDLEKTFAEVFETHCTKAMIPEGYRKEYYRLEMLEDLRTFVREVKLPPAVRTLTEQQFNVPIANGLRLRGRIDRLDVRDDGRVLIIDYKYSRSDRIRSIVQDDDGLQGPLYVIAAKEQWNVNAAGMYFCSVRRDPRFQHVTIGGWSIPGAEAAKNTGALTAEWLQNARSRAENLAQRIQSAEIAPNPADPSICARCDYRDVCRYEAGAKTLEAAE